MQRDSATNYREFCAMPVDPEVQRMVTVDLPRTFANNLLFSTGPAGEAPYVEMLRSILFATSQSRSDVKYCPGLNYIAALLLLVQRDEEKAFWTLNAIMSHVFSKDYFNEQLTGARIDQNIMEMLVRKQCPEMSKELDQMGCAISVFTFPWFICLFINTLPFTSVLRIWDVVILEGDKALLRIALALVSIGERDLLKCHDFSDFSHVFR